MRASEGRINAIRRCLWRAGDDAATTGVSCDRFCPLLRSLALALPGLCRRVTRVATNVAKLHGSIGAPPCCAKGETTEETIEEMADRRAEIRYLREKARQFRQLARTYRTEISPRLNEIARELDDRANTLEMNEG